MKNRIFTVVARLALIGFFSITPALAQDKAPTDHTQHDGHPPDATASPSTGPKAMGTNGDMMAMCHSKMNKSECKKMMNQAKAKSGTTKKK